MALPTPAEVKAIPFGAALTAAFAAVADAKVQTLPRPAYPERRPTCKRCPDLAGGARVAARAAVAAAADAWEARATTHPYDLASWQQGVRTRNRRVILALRGSAEIAQVNSRAERRRHYRRLLRSWRGLEPVE